MFRFIGWTTLALVGIAGAAVVWLQVFATPTTTVAVAPTGAPAGTRAVIVPPAANPPAAPPPAAAKPPAPPTAAPPRTTPNGAEPGLVEAGELGPLPRIGPDGRRPVAAYARAFDRRDPRPRIAVIVAELGLHRALTERAIEALPGEVTLAFSPYGDDLAQWFERARRAGHEVLVSLPMEPANRQQADSGPRALLPGLSDEENRRNLLWAMSRGVGYVGVIGEPGGRFAGDAARMRPILTEIAARGVMFVDRRPAANGAVLARPGLVFARTTEEPQPAASPTALGASLHRAEAAARRGEPAVVVVEPYPAIVAGVKLWLDGLAAKGLAAAPISAVAGEIR
jgi:uncharacterized protein